MQKRELNYIISIIVLLVFAAGVVFLLLRKPLSPSEAKIMGFPLKIGLWEGTVQEPDELTVSILGTDKILLARYTNPAGEKVLFTVVYGEGNRLSFHPPEYCYIGSGNTELIAKSLDKIDLDGGKCLNFNKMIFQTGPVKQMVFYWYSVGDRMTASYYKQQFYFVLDEIRYRKSKGALIRISTLVVDGDVEGALGRLKRFMKETIPLLPSYL